MSSLSDSRSPVLDYASENPIPTYRPPAVIIDHGDILGSEDGFDIQTEDLANIGIEI